jgi:hypothetical protein
MTAIQALNFHDGTLEMQLSAPDATTLDHVIQSLKGNGWQAKQTSGNAAPSGYQGRIELRPN